MKMTRGSVFLATLDPTVGSELRKTRPVVIVSNDANNEKANTVTVVPLTSKNLDRIHMFEVKIALAVGTLPVSSKAKVDQIRTIDKSRLVNRFGKVDAKTMLALNKAMRIHLDL